MTRQQTTRNVTQLQALLQEQDDLLRPLLQLAVQGDSRSRDERHARRGQGRAHRLLPAQAQGTLELRVPQDRQGRFSTALFERCQRSEKALVTASSKAGRCW
jgi:transposase-like protein